MKNQLLSEIIILLALIGGIITAEVVAEDIVWIEKGTGSALQNQTEYGTILSSSPEGLIFKDSRGTRQYVIRQLAAVQYEEEPVELILARIQYRASDNKAVLEAIHEIPPEVQAAFSANIREEKDYLLCMANMRLLLAALKKAALKKADSGKKEENDKSTPLELDEKIDWTITLADKFFKDYPHSWHLFEVARVAKDICYWQKNFNKAIFYCDYLSRVDWPELKLEGLFQKGQILFTMNQLSEADKVFQQIGDYPESTKSDPELQKILRYKIQAGLKQAEIEFTKGQNEEAIKKYQSLIEKYQKETLPENDEFLLCGAQMYNGLGTALIKQGRRKEAIHAFLHVDLLYSEVKEEREKALRHLEVLWREEGYPARSREIRARLEQ